MSAENRTQTTELYKISAQYTRIRAGYPDDTAPIRLDEIEKLFGAE